MENALARLEQLSAQSRRQRAWLIALSIVLVGCGITGARNPDRDVVRARRFEAIDEKGRVLAILASQGSSGAPMLALLDDEGEAFAFLTKLDSTREGTTEKTNSVVLSLGADDAAASEHSGGTVLGATPRGGILSLSHIDDEGTCQEHIALGISEDWTGLRINHEEKPLVELKAAGNKATLEIHDGEGKSLFHAP